MPLTSSTRRKRKKALIKRDGAECAHCKEPDKGIMDNGHSFLTIDHIIPSRDGGSNKLGNLRLLCHACHRYADNMKLGGRYPRRGEGLLSEQLPPS